MILTIKNFRSIRDQEVELAPITVVYGPNGGGKSSLLYALLTLKNIILNPNQATAGFFNYIFASLGGFDAVVFDHRKNEEIELGVKFRSNNINLSYRVIIGESKGSFALEVENGLELKLDLSVPFPYPANQQAQGAFSIAGTSFNANWNGILAQVQPVEPNAEALKEANAFTEILNSPAELLRTVDVVPLRRGFSKPYYSAAPISPMLVTEDELATHLSNDKYLVGKVSHYLEEILARDFRSSTKPGTAIYSLDATDKRTGVLVELVNEGFGVNQMVYLLAKALRSDVHRICIEEPEIHLHPTAVRQFARALVEIVREDGKEFVVATHSGPFLAALLALVASGELKHTELACYFAHKEKKTTQFDRQTVNEKGQIEGGLTVFLEGELEDVKTFLNVANKIGA